MGDINGNCGAWRDHWRPDVQEKENMDREQSNGTSWAMCSTAAARAARERAREEKRERERERETGWVEDHTRVGGQINNTFKHVIGDHFWSSLWFSNKEHYLSVWEVRGTMQQHLMGIYLCKRAHAFGRCRTWLYFNKLYEYYKEMNTWIVEIHPQDRFL